MMNWHYDDGCQKRGGMVHIRKGLWPLVTWLILLILIVSPVLAASLGQDPVLPGDPGSESEEALIESGPREGGAGGLGAEPASAPAILDEFQLPAPDAVLVAPASVASRMALAAWTSDLPSYDEEVVTQFDVNNAYEIIRNLSVDIGPRVSSTPQEMEAAQYLGSLLQSYGYDVTIQLFSRTTTIYAARVTSPNRVLPGGPKWQMRGASNARITGDADPVVAEVVWAGSGQSPSDFPPDTAGKIVVMNWSATASVRNTAVVNAVNRGAVGVIFVRTEENAAPPGAFTLTPAQSNVPVVAGGSAHRVWIQQLLAEGPLTLAIATNSYINMPGVNVIGVKRAVNDPAGTTAPIVMFGGHMDSVLGSPGANDNASGASAGVEIARVLSQYAYDKEIRVAAWGGEEAGLLGSRAYANALSPAERARFVGYWNMDMMATPYTEAGTGLWAHTTDGLPNYVTQSAYEAAARIGFTNIDGCRDSSSDHASFANVGIPSAFFIWEAHYKPAPPDTCATRSGRYVSEPQYHRPTDTITENISPERLEIVLKVVGGSVFHSALNAVTLSAADYLGAPIVGATVRADCGEGWRRLGTTDGSGVLRTVIPHAICDFTATTADGLSVSRLDDVEVFGDRSLQFPPPPVLSPFVEPNTLLLHSGVTANPNVIYAFGEYQASCDPLDTGSVGSNKVVTCTVVDAAGGTATASTTYNVIYGFAGFFAPVENPPVLNVANSGRAVPLKWRLVDANGEPVLSGVEARVRVEGFACPLGGTVDQVEEYATGASGLQNLGDGYYQYNWATPKSYARSCKKVVLDLGEGLGWEHTALFSFVR